jgi:hypothetical protein
MVSHHYVSVDSIWHVVYRYTRHLSLDGFESRWIKKDVLSPEYCGGKTGIRSMLERPQRSSLERVDVNEVKTFGL